MATLSQRLILSVLSILWKDTIGYFLAMEDVHSDRILGILLNSSSVQAAQFSPTISFSVPRTVCPPDLQVLCAQV